MNHTPQDIDSILSELPSRFVEMLEQANTMADLRKLKAKHRCYNRTICIDARMENLRHKTTP